MNDTALLLGAIAAVLYFLNQGGDLVENDNPSLSIDQPAESSGYVLQMLPGPIGDVLEVMDGVKKLSQSRVQQIIRDAAADAGIEPAIMLAVAKQESGFNPANINKSDPSYGLFQIQLFWLKYFGYPQDAQLLLDPVFASQLAGQILNYFKGRINSQTRDYFQLPAEIDIYNVGETLWNKGRRNLAYRDSVLKFYRDFGGTAA